MKRVLLVACALLVACGGGGTEDSDQNCIEDRCFVIERFEVESNDTIPDPVGDLGSGESAIIRGTLRQTDVDRFSVSTIPGGQFVVYLYITSSDVLNPVVRLTGTAAADSDTEIATGGLASIALTALPVELVEIRVQFETADADAFLNYRLEINGPF